MYATPDQATLVGSAAVRHLVRVVIARSGTLCIIGKTGSMCIIRRGSAAMRVVHLAPHPFLDAAPEVSSGINSPHQRRALVDAQAVCEYIRQRSGFKVAMTGNKRIINFYKIRTFESDSEI